MANQITREQWERIANVLRDGESSVEFSFEGHSIWLARMRVKESRSAIVVYLNGKVSGEWVQPTDPKCLSITFWRQCSKALYPPSKVKRLEKSVGVRAAKKHFPDLHARVTHYQPTFNAAASVVRQYKKIAGLKLVKIGSVEYD